MRSNNQSNSSMFRVRKISNQSYAGHGMGASNPFNARQQHNAALFQADSGFDIPESGMPAALNPDRHRDMLQKNQMKIQKMQEKKERQQIQQSANDFFGQMVSHFGGDEDGFEDEPNRKPTSGKMLLKPISKTQTEQKPKQEAMSASFHSPMSQHSGKLLKPQHRSRVDQQLSSNSTLAQQQTAGIARMGTHGSTGGRMAGQKGVKPQSAVYQKQSDESIGSNKQRSDIDKMSADELRQVIENDRDSNAPMILASSKGFGEQKKQIVPGPMYESQNISQRSSAHSSQNADNISTSTTPSTQSLLLFNPNEIVDDNTMVAMMVKQNITLLQKCLKSSNKAIFNAAIDSLKNASNMFGPALNKHLKHILPLIKKKQDLASKQAIQSLKDTLVQNGGNDAKTQIESSQF